MQITQTNTSGLRREYRITIGAGDIDRQVQEKLKALGNQVRLPGFRPGKAPVALLRKQYGRAVLGEVLQETVNTATQKTIQDENLRPALEPRIEVTKFEEGTDLEYTMAVEVMPEITPIDFRQIKLERLVASVEESDIDAMLRQLADQQKTFAAVAPARPAAKGDAVLVDFVGKVGGTAFEGGSAKDYLLELGSGSFIPGFEDQLIGAGAGERRDVNVTFPSDYGNQDLAGKAAVFEVEVKEVRETQPVEIGDDLAKRMGLENLAALRDAVKRQLEQDYASVTRNRLKRSLLDALADGHSFPVPEGMVDMEFNQIWEQVKGQPGGIEAETKSSGKSEDTLKEDYRKIAERRVRLGLLLSEVGQRSNIEVKPDEVTKAMIEQARRFPGQERQVMEFYQKNPEALARLRAPIYEDKVVDYILELAQLTERKVSRDELVQDPEAVEAQEGVKS